MWSFPLSWQYRLAILQEFTSEIIGGAIGQEQLDTDCIQKLVYIAGYLCKNYIMEENDESTFDYYLKYGDYLDEIDRGKVRECTL